MKAIQYHRYGGPEVLQLEDVAVPEPGPGQVRVVVKAAGLNPMDMGIRQGLVKMMTGSKFPRGLGHDFSGIVEAVGSEVTRFKAGDEVFGGAGLKEAGCFAEKVIANEKDVWMKPPALSFEEAGAMSVVSFTAWTGLVAKAKVKAGQTVFINGCLGGVGRAATQIALLKGAKVTGSCGASRVEDAKALGVSEVVDYNGLDPSQHRGRFDIVFDTQAKLSMKQCEIMLKRGGVAVHVDFSPLKFLRCLFSRRHFVIIANPDAEAVAGVTAAAAQRMIVPHVGRTVPLSQAIPAIIDYEATGLPRGKLVITPEA